MYDIKELTRKYHKDAERQAYVKVLMSGEIPEKLYAVFLYNQLQCYAALEKYAQENSLFRTTVGLQRAEHLLYDFNALWKKEEKPEIFESTKEYIEHVEGIRDDPEKLYAHIYVRHMGDLKGGQMIASRVPGKGLYYKFEDPEVLESLIREKLREDEEFVEECKKCFTFATKSFEDIKDYIDKNM